MSMAGATHHQRTSVIPTIDELAAEVRSQIASAWRFRWWGVAAAWLCAVAGGSAVVLQSDVYEANARVYVDSSSMLRPILNNQLSPADVGSQLAYVRQALLGRTHLERVAQANALGVQAKTPAELESVLESLRQRIEITSRDDTNLYLISYRNSDRDKAIGVVTTLLNSLVDDTIGAQQASSGAASRFLDERVGEYEARLQAAEHTLADFKKRNSDRLPGSSGGYFERLRTSRDALAEKETALRLAHSRREQIRAQLGSESPVMPSGIAPPRELAPSSLDARIRDQRADLERLLLTYTDRHPDVINAREALDRLERQRAQQLEALGFDGPDQEISSLGTNPVYQSLRIALSEADVAVTTLETEVSERRAAVDSLQALIDEVPDVEAQLARLNRDYDVVYEQYQSLVRTRESQNLSEKAQDLNQMDFRVLDPPLADFKPVGPNRLLHFAFVFVLALGGGGGLCWLLAQLSPVFHGVATLRSVCELPVIGSVSHAAPQRLRIRQRVAALVFVGVMGTLVVAFATAALIELVGPGVRTLVGLA